MNHHELLIHRAFQFGALQATANAVARILDSMAEEMRHMTPAEAGRLRELQAERLQRLAKELRDQVARCTEGETV